MGDSQDIEEEKKVEWDIEEGSEKTKGKRFIKKFNQNYNPSEQNTEGNFSKKENFKDEIQDQLISMNEISVNKFPYDFNLSQATKEMNMSTLRISRMYKDKNQMVFDKSKNCKLGKSQNGLRTRKRPYNMSNSKPIGRQNSFDHFEGGDSFLNQLNQFEKSNSMKQNGISSDKNILSIPNLSGFNTSQSHGLLISHSSKPSPSMMLISSK
jgi:hypothetical protein